MAGPSNAVLRQPLKPSPINVVPSDQYQEVDAGSDSLFLDYPSKQIVTSVDMTLAVVLWPSGQARTVRCFEKVPEPICISQILATGSTFNTGYVKVYQ